jgi:hypothetical protein
MRSLAVALALIVAVLATQARVVIGGSTWDDATYQTEIVPPRLAAANAIHAGTWPAWWEGASLGVPLAAEPSHSALAPAMWISSTAHGLDLVMVLNVAWLALGVVLWARRRGATDLAALTAGVLLATTGLVTATALRGALPALADVPWIGLCAIELAAAEAPRVAARWAALLGLLLGLVGLAGQFGILVDSVALAIAFGATRRTWRYLAIALVAGLAIAAVQWWAVWHTDTTGATTYGLSPVRLVELVVPGSFGALDPAHGIPAFASGAASLPSLFSGAALLGLAFVPRTLAARGRYFAIALVIAAFVVGRGGWPAWLGAPELHLAVLIVLMSVRAAAGADAFIAGEKRALVVLAIAAGVAALLAWCMVALEDTTGAKADVVWRAVIEGATGAGLVLGAVALARLASKLRFLALALLVAPNLGSLRSTAPVTDAIATPKWATSIDGASPRRLYRNAKLEKPGEPSTSEAIATLAGDAAARWDITAVRTDDPARSRNDDAAYKASAHGGGEFLERYGISYAVLPASVTEAQQLVELDRRALWALAKYPAAPPAVVVTTWQWATDDATALEQLFPAAGGRGIPAGSVLLRGSGDAPVVKGGRASTCTIERWGPGAIDLQCTAPAAGYAVVSSSTSPRWSVTVDGADQPWVTADVLRRAVAVSAGAHAIHWRYARASLSPLAVGLAGLALLLVLSLPTHRRRT